MASLWFAWFVVVGCARPGACSTKPSCCCETSSRGADTATLRELMPCCRVVTRAVAPRTPVTPAPLPPTLLPATTTLPLPSVRLAARTASPALAAGPPLYRVKCALLL